MTSQNSSFNFFNSGSCSEDISDDGEPPLGGLLNDLILTNSGLRLPVYDKNLITFQPLINYKNQAFPISDTSIKFYQKHFPDSDISNWSNWNWQLRNKIRTLKHLETIVDLSNDERAILEKKFAKGKLPIAITPYYASLIDTNNPEQALRRTVIPVIDEMLVAKEEALDPLGEDTTRPVNGVIHRYPDRALLLVTNFCSVNCRYCTRSRVVGDASKQKTGFTYWQTSIDYIKAHPEIRDVIISGGDPLTLSDNQIEWLLSSLSKIKHLDIIRIGTKIPAVLPQRITKRLVKILQKHKNLFISLHFTHPDELTVETKEACTRLADVGIPLGSQTVLLKGINDNVPTMKKLFHELLKVRVRPYYLYQCDLILGSTHFRTTVEKGLEIIKGLRGHTSGYAIPHYVIDAPGGGGKIPILPDYYKGRNGSKVILSNYQDKTYTYYDPVDKDKNEKIMVGITYDLKKDYKQMGYSNEEIAEFDNIETIEAIEASLKQLGYETERIGNINQLVHMLNHGKKWDLVFNIAEGLHGISRESQIPNLLDAYGIPSTFSTSTIHSLAQHKGLVKHVLNDKGIPTAGFKVIEEMSDLDTLNFEYPLFAKPVAEGSSKGISSTSKINNKQELYKTVTELLSKFKQPVIVEEYLPGREFTVGIVGTGSDAKALGVLEVSVTKKAEQEIYSYEIKQNYLELVKYNIVTDSDAQQSAEVALRAWKALGCRDGGRIDIRIDKHGVPNFIEVNTLAGLNPMDSDLPIMCRHLKISYTELIKMIMDSAVKRLSKVVVDVTAS